jgi:hypothetical protein
LHLVRSEVLGLDGNEAGIRRSRRSGIFLYQGDAARRRRYVRTHLSSCVDMAERLGVPALAAALTATFDGVARAEVPVSLQRPEESSFLVPPASHRVRLRIVASRLLRRLRRRSSRS